MYKYIFFDWDRTLWDFETNSEAALSEVFEVYLLEKRLKTSLAEYLRVYRHYNAFYWDLYAQRKVDKEELKTMRFVKTLQNFSVFDDDLSEQLSMDYFLYLSAQQRLMPGAEEILRYLYDKNMTIGILTNGFYDIQHKKLMNTNLASFIDYVFTSEEMGCPKPDAAFFQKALNYYSADKKDCLMIGDDWIADIMGAKNFGIDTVYYSPGMKEKKEGADFYVSHLLDLKKIL